jgi:hypothetical protein
VLAMAKLYFLLASLINKPRKTPSSITALIKLKTQNSIMQYAGNEAVKPQKSVLQSKK